MPRHFPNWIEAYLEYAKHSEAPDPFHYWTAVSTIAGALRRRVWIDMGYFKWHPNFFIFFVAPAGIVAKSTTAGIGLDILAELPFIHIGPAATSWQALVRKLSEIQEEIAYPDGSFQAQSAITIFASELGTFLDPRDRGMIDALVSLWDGKEGPWVKMTKQDGEEVVINPFINIIGCTTPSWIAENMTEYFSGGGFASRTVFVYAEKKRRLVANPWRHMPENTDEYRRKLISDLEEISSLLGPFQFTEDAIDWTENWYEEHFYGKHPHIQSERFDGYLARKQTHLYKLAMIISASRSSNLTITLPDITKAFDQVTILEKDMMKVYGRAQREKSAVFAADMIEYIQTNGAIAKDELFRKHMKTMSWTTYEEVIKSMINSGYIEYENIAGIIMLTPTEKK